MLTLLPFLILAQVPNWTLKDINGNDVTLDSLLVEGPVVVEFWATHCVPCIQLLDCFKEIKKELDSLLIEDTVKVNFVAISQDGPRSKRNVIPTVRKRQWDFTVLYDDNKIAMQMFNIKAIPQIFIIAKDREVIYHHIGYRKGDEKKIREKLLAYLKTDDHTEDNLEENITQ